MLVLNRSEQSKQAPLVRAKAAAKEAVNREADAVRRLYITPIAGQELIYLNKEKEAREFLAQDPEPTDLTPYPFIASEIGTTGYTAYEVASIFAWMAEQWRSTGAEIERLRVCANSDILEATSTSEVDQILSQYIQEMSALR